MRRRALLSEFTLDPASVTAVQARDDGLTVPGLHVGDIILAIGPQGLIADIQPSIVRVATANTLDLRSANPTAAGVNAASQTWVLANLRMFPLQEVTINPASVGANESPSEDITVNGLQVGDVVLAIPPNALINDLTAFAARIAAVNTLPLRFNNPSAGAVDAASQTWTLVNLRGLPMYEVTIDPASVLTNVAPSQNITLEGLQVGDVVLVIMPQAIIADVSFTALRVSALNTLPLRGFNPSAGTVDATSQTYVVVKL